MEVTRRELERLRYWARKRGGLRRFLEIQRLEAAGLRVCCDCKRELPATAEFFSSRGGRWFHSECKECGRERSRNWRTTNAQRVKQGTKYRLNRRPIHTRQAAMIAISSGSDPLLILQRITQGWSK